MSLTSTDSREASEVSPDQHGRLTSFDVAKLLRVSVSTVTRISRDRLPYTETPGGHRRYELAAVERYQAQLDGRPAISTEQRDRPAP